MEWIKNNLPLITISMIFFGLLRTATFYSIFEIDIISFIEVSEVIQLQYLFFVGILWAIMILYNSSSSIIRRQYRNKIVKIEKELNRNEVSLLALRIELDAISKESPNPDIVKIKSDLEEIIDTNDHQKSEVSYAKTDLYYLLLGILFVVGFLISTGFAYKDAYNLKNKSNFEVDFIYNNDTIQTNKTYQYLGRTKNYTFLYDRTKQEATVYANSDIKKIKFKKGIEYNTSETNTPQPHKAKPGRMPRN